jgi:L-methionine (R)-S-oxide reductase
METQNLFSHILLGTRSREDKAKMIAEEICRSMNYSWAGLYNVSDSTINMIACSGPEPTFTSFPSDKGLNGRAVQDKDVVVVNDTEKDPDYLLTFSNTQSEIIIPVFSANGVVKGTIDVASKSKNTFGAKDIDFLATCAKQIGQLWD